MYRCSAQRQPEYELDTKPKALQGVEKVNERAAQHYQAYLRRIRPIAQADFYTRLMKRQNCTSIRALARLTGRHWSGIARILKLLELPNPILTYLRSHEEPEVVMHFTEKRLAELFKLEDPDAIWRRFRETLRSLGAPAC